MVTITVIIIMITIIIIYLFKLHNFSMKITYTKEMKTVSADR